MRKLGSQRIIHKCPRRIHSPIDPKNFTHKHHSSQRRAHIKRKNQGNFLQYPRCPTHNRQSPTPIHRKNCARTRFPHPYTTTHRLGQQQTAERAPSNYEQGVHCKKPPTPLPKPARNQHHWLLFSPRNQHGSKWLPQVLVR